MPHFLTTTTQSQLSSRLVVSIAQYTAGLLGGVVLYFIAILLSRQDYSGIYNLIFQPFIAIGFSLLFLVVAIILGLPLIFLQSRLRLLRSHILYAVVFFTGLILFYSAFAYDLISPVADTTIVGLCFIIGYYLVIFAIVTWPLFARPMLNPSVVAFEH